jgi:hypothetical protein
MPEQENIFDNIFNEPLVSAKDYPADYTPPRRGNRTIREYLKALQKYDENYYCSHPDKPLP